MMSMASFLALNIYCKLIILVLDGQFTSSHILVSINILYSLAIPIFYIIQSALFIASCKAFGFNVRYSSYQKINIKFTNGGLSFSSFHFPFSFLFILFSYFLFLEHRVRVRSQDTENKVEGSRTNDDIQHGYHMWTSCSTHGHLG